MTCRVDSTRIGGEFELDPTSFLNTQAAAPPFTMPGGRSIWTDTGRSALLLAAADILKKGGEPLVWMPAFCCRSVAQAFHQAGFSIRYYSSVELHGGDSPPPEPATGQTVLLVHYFGHLNSYRLAQAPSWRSRGAFIVEDAAQAGLTQGVGSAGHYVITSLRKFVPQPDGAMIRSEFELEWALAEPDEEFVSARVVAKLMRGSGSPSQAFLPLLERTEYRLDTQPIVPRRPSWVSKLLMAHTDFPSITERRRQNWELLRRSLRDRGASDLTVLHDTLASGEAPLGLAVRVSGQCRADLRRFLRDHSVFCPVHWPLAHVPPSFELTADHELSSQILTLPIDQRMDESHVHRLVGLLQRFFTGKKVV